MTLVEDPALDTGVLARLSADLVDDAFVASLAERFDALLPGRLDRIAAALGAEDADAAMDAVLSLKASAGTIGARELARLAYHLEQAVRRHHLADAVAALPMLHAAALACRQALADYLGR